MDNPIISTKNLCKTYQGVKAADNVSLEIEKRELFGLHGPNGAGKMAEIMDADCDASAFRNLRKHSKTHS